MIPVHLVVASLLSWLQREQSEAIVYLREGNRILKAQLRNQRVRLTDDERRRLATIGARLGRRLLTQLATIVTPDTILRWHRRSSRDGRDGHDNGDIDIGSLDVALKFSLPSFVVCAQVSMVLLRIFNDVLDSEGVIQRAIPQADQRPAHAVHRGSRPP